MKDTKTYSFDLDLSSDDVIEIEKIKSEIDEGKHSGWKWSEFVLIGLQMFSKMLDRGLDSETFEYILDNLDDIKYQSKNKKNKQVDVELLSFDKIIGLNRIKEKIKRLSSLINRTFWIKKSMNYVFVGKPGTGKSMMARALTKEFFDNNIIKENKLIEVDRSRLVGEYTGQTAPKVRRCFEEAVGGVLFIDEAYSLNSDDGYGLEAISEITKLMEDYRGKLVVILAGYKEETMIMLKLNPGMHSRINDIFDFEDYTEDELRKILKLFAEKAMVDLDKNVENKIIKLGMRNKWRRDYGNARDLRNVFEGVLEYWASREPTDPSWNAIKMEDVLNWHIDNKIILDSDVYDA